MTHWGLSRQKQTCSTVNHLEISYPQLPGSVRGCTVSVILLQSTVNVGQDIPVSI